MRGEACVAIMSFLIDVFEYFLVVCDVKLLLLLLQYSLNQHSSVLSATKKRDIIQFPFIFQTIFFWIVCELWMNGRMGVPVNKINEFESFSWEVFPSKWINFPISYWIETWLPDDFIIDSGIFSIWENTFKWKFRMRMHNQFSSNLNQ